MRAVLVQQLADYYGPLLRRPGRAEAQNSLGERSLQGGVKDAVLGVSASGTQVRVLRELAGVTTVLLWRRWRCRPVRPAQ